MHQPEFRVPNIKIRPRPNMLEKMDFLTFQFGIIFPDYIIIGLINCKKTIE